MRRTILFSSYMSSSAGRRHLAGIFRYIAEKNRDWEIIPEKFIGDMTDERTSQLLNYGLHGVITAGLLPSTLLTDVLKSQIPIVEIEGRLLPAKVRVFLDEEAIGRLAAEHLLTFGNFAEFGYVPYRTTSNWSYLRMKGFALALAKHGRRALVKGRKTDMETWLNRLRRPAAVFCACDMTADDVIRAATKINICVPKDLSVLGVDDDELYCDNSIPPLSSVRPGHENSGYAAAELLDMIFRGEKPKDRRVSPQGVTSRSSVAACRPAAALVEHASQLVNEHATEGWSVDGIANALHVSRRLLSLRYAQFRGESVHTALTNRKLQEVKRLLSTTKITIKDIVPRAGFNNANNLKRLFKRRFGVTMREFRTNASAKGGTKRK